MFAQERLENIMEILNINGKVLVKDLSERFNVTEDCIRKDLKNLEKQDLIKRTYGGAVLKRKAAINNNILNRKNIHVENKRIIASKAYNIIKDRETIFLDISTTNILLAKEIAKGGKNIIVITNMLDIMNVLSNSKHIKTISVGGILNNELNGFIGSTAIESVSKYNLDRAFIGSCGVNMFDNSVTTFDVEDGNTKKSIINSSKKVFLVMEEEKFYFDGVYKFADINDIDSIIVDKKPDDKIFEVLKKMDIDVI